MSGTINNFLIDGNFQVAGLDFVDYFNKFRFAYPMYFPNPLVKVNFERWVNSVKDFSGKDKITVNEFIGHFGITYNETGGTFYPIREYGGAQYFFNDVQLGNGQIKPTYNRYPNRLAGDQLKAWGVIQTDNEVAIWNGKVYPIGALLSVLQFAENCDFAKYSGWGFNQLTWLDNFIRCVQPFLPKALDQYTKAELDAVLVGNIPLACKVYHAFITMNRNSIAAIEQLDKGNFTDYGNVVSGGWAWYVNTKYVPRCITLQKAIANQILVDVDDLIIKKYAIDGMNLFPAQIKMMQAYLMKQSPAIWQRMVNSGGADGAWGSTSQWAFEQTKLSIEDVLVNSGVKPKILQAA